MNPPLPHNPPTDDDNDLPTQDELVDQLQRSDDNKTGPDKALRENIEKFSRYSPVYKAVTATILRATIAPAIVVFLAYQLSPSEEITSLAGSVSRSLWILCPSLVTQRMIPIGFQVDRENLWLQRFQGIVAAMR